MYEDGPIFLAVNDSTYFAFYRELLSVWTLNLSCSRLSVARDERKKEAGRARKSRPLPESSLAFFSRLLLAISLVPTNSESGTGYFLDFDVTLEQLFRFGGCGRVSLRNSSAGWCFLTILYLLNSLHRKYSLFGNK